MTIAPDSSSYPILGAARAAGVDYALALALVEANVGRVEIHADRAAWIREIVKIGREIERRHGAQANDELCRLLCAAVDEGRIYMGPQG